MLYAYVRGQLIIAGLIGVLSGIACAVLGLPDPVAIGLIAGVTALIPYLGPSSARLPAILVGLAAGPIKAPTVARRLLPEYPTHPQLRLSKGHG